MGKLAMKTHFSSVAVIGLGLIGSSFAAMYRNAYPDARLVGIDVSEDAVKAAQERGWIDEGHVSSEDLGSVLYGNDCNSRTCGKRILSYHCCL